MGLSGYFVLLEPKVQRYNDKNPVLADGKPPKLKGGGWGQQLECLTKMSAHSLPEKLTCERMCAWGFCADLVLTTLSM